MSKRYLVLVASLLLFAAGCADDPASPDDGHAEWNYEAVGDWVKGYPECGGLIQSPINIVTSDAIQATLPDLVRAIAMDSATIIDNGHSIQVTFPNATQTLQVLGTTYKLGQFHFHRKSEHSIDGAHAEMEAHFVFLTSTGAIAVIAVMLDSGAANPLIETLWQQIPTVKKVAKPLTSPVDISSLIPVEVGYWMYTGSLTTPPCSQGLSFCIMKMHKTMSGAQLQTFAAKYANNARPILPQNGRPVLDHN